MKNIRELEKDADESGLIFLNRFASALEKLRPIRLSNAILSAVDTNFSSFKIVRKRVAKNPLPLFAAFAGISLLFRQIIQTAVLSRSNMPVRRSVRNRTKLKGDNHGKYISPE
jgi:hypothetical protein